MADTDPPNEHPAHDSRWYPAEEYFAPLLEAAPDAWHGRIRNLAEARSALRIPTSREEQVLLRSGTPPDRLKRVCPVSDPDHPERVAEFAYLRVLTRATGRLAPLARQGRLRFRETSNAFWIVHGSIILAAHGSLVIDSLSIAPAFDGQMSDRRDDAALGITGELLRLIRPTQILNETVTQLQVDGYILDVFAPHIERPISSTHRALLDSIGNAPLPPPPPISDDELAELAKRYIVLCQMGVRTPLPQLAREFGISRTQARYRIHKARKARYLAPGQPGRATPNIGPRLRELGWEPPSIRDSPTPRQNPPAPHD